MVRLYADLHVHSRYSAATSRDMTIEEIDFYATMKGLNIVGTGDALHGSWLKELKSKLTEVDDSGIYKSKSGGSTLFIVQTEVATIHEYEGKTRRIHHVITMSNLDKAEELREKLRRYGELDTDGRPILSIRPAELVEILLETDRNIVIFPAHAWTPWWGIFGSISGVNKMEECYEDMAKHINALETGLSSDPSMNWRISALDRYTLLSFSDSHSPYPYRLGREATVFNLKEKTYREIAEAIKNKDPTKIVMTVEVNPAYGKGFKPPDVPLVGP
ncbi:MAG: endonuclease Q family protein [Candidatus Bathyarchaeia archaeon]